MNGAGKLIASVVLAVALFVWLLVYYQMQISTVGILFFICSMVLLVPVILARDIFFPLTYFSLNFFIRIIQFLELDRDGKTIGFYDTADPSYWLSYSLILIMVWSGFMYAGYHFTGGKKWLQTKDLGLMRHRFQNTRVLLLLLCGVFLPLYIVIAMVQGGGVVHMIQNMSNRTELYSGVLTQLAVFLPLPAIFLMEHKKKGWALVVLLLSVLITFLMGSRTDGLLGILFPFVIFYHYTIKPLSKKKLLVLGFVFLMLFMLLGTIRKTGSLSDPLGTTNSLTDMLLSISSSRKLGYTLPSLVASINEGAVDFQYGTTYLGIFAAFIPRSIWPGKPIVDEAGVVGNLLIGEDYFGLPTGPFGVAYLNFGILGVILIGFLTGMVVKKIYLRATTFSVTTSGSGASVSLFVYCIIYPLLTSIFMTSALMNILTILVIFGVLYIFDNYLIRKRRYD